ncbi:MAG: hypothetical protein H0X33_14380 [Taibaiella sp.]|nr:hypothetical protein [Taibaiella sp.]
MKKENIFTCVIAMLVLCSCQDRSKQRTERKDVIIHENNTLKRIYIDDTGKIIKYYSLDKKSKGSETHYDNKGRIIKWLWYKSGLNFIQYGIYYDSLQRIQRSIGNPFLNAVKFDKNQLAIEMANPPIVKYIFKYREWYNDKVIEQFAKYPGKTDTTAWVVIDLPKFLQNHKYIIYYCVIGTNNKIVDSSFQEIAP